MKHIVGILFVGIFAAGCAAPRYDVRVTSAPTESARANWVAVRIDRKTGETWYSKEMTPGSGRQIWQPVEDLQIIKK
jgi:hypothetical protein